MTDKPLARLFLFCESACVCDHDGASRTVDGHSGREEGTALGSLLKRLLKTLLFGCSRGLRRLKPKAYRLPERELMAGMVGRGNLRIAVLACHWIGDTFWAAQVMPSLRMAFPGASVTVFTKPHSAWLWRGAFAADAVRVTRAIVSDRRRENVDWRALFREARAEAAAPYDLLVDLTGNRYSAWFSCLCGASIAVGFDGGEWGGLYSRRVAGAERRGVHLSERPFRVLEGITGRFAYIRPQAPTLPVTYEEACRACGLSPQTPLVVISPGAGWAGKEWPEEKFAACAGLAVKRGWQVAVADAPGGRARCERIAGAAFRSRSGKGGAEPRAAVVCEAAADTALGLLGGCALWIGNDSGFAHLAAALGKPTHVVFTEETVPAVCGPLGPDVHIHQAGTVLPEHLVAAIDPRKS